MTRFEVCFSRRLCVEEEFRISRRHGYYYDKKPRRIRLHLTSTVLHGLAFTVQMCTCAWVCCLCCPCTFQCPLRLCWNVCIRGHFFLFLYRELPLCCLVWLDRSVSPGVIYCFHNFQSECCVLRRRGGGGGNLSSYRYSKVFFDLQTGLIRNFGGGSEELFGFCVAWPPVYQSRYTWHKHKIVRTPAKIVGTVFVFWLSITFLHSSGGASFRNGSKEK